MKHASTVKDCIRFHADFVDGYEEQFTPECIVHGIYFGEGDPERGGEHWNFTRDLHNDDGVCTVKEIQQSVCFEGIQSISLSRSTLECRFDEAGATETRVRLLVVTFALNHEAWERLRAQAQLVFRDRAYALLADV